MFDGEAAGLAGRDPGDIRKALVFGAVLGADEAEASDALIRRAEGLRADPEAMRRTIFVGTPEQFAARLAPFVDLGVGDFLMMARPPADERSMVRLASQVAPQLR